MGALQLTIKTLQQKQFKLDVDSSDSILSVKEKIQESQGHPVAQQKLIFSGKILVDDKKVEEYSISEKDFLVVMVSKPKTTPASSSASTPKPAATTTTPATGVVTTETEKPKEATTTSQATETSNEAQAPSPVRIPAATTAPPVAAVAETEANQEQGDAQLLTGSKLDGVILNMMEMGFEREQCVRALRASFNNPDRAVEYLFNGIPEHVLSQMNVSQSPQSQQQQSVPQQTQEAGTTTANTDAASAPTAETPSNAPLNLFAAAQQQQQQQQQQEQQQSAAGSTDFANLRNTAHFQQIRQLVQSNPSLLQPLLQQLGQSNPELLRSINADPNGFLQALLEGVDDEEGAPPGSSMVHVTAEEKDAIDRLVALGFDRSLVIEAYFACEKDEELAANYLFENGDEDME